MQLAPGDTLGPYEIIGPLGRGGMGEVYRARDTRLAREVAIKVAAAQFGDRFEREAHAIAALNHPNICTLHDVGPNYLVMELVEGPTLADRIRQGAIPPDEALAIATQIADALQAAHDKGITHRDLKPANVKVREDGTVKVLDFGLAKMLDPTMVGRTDAGASEVPTLSSPAMTGIGTILGTAGYMAPEQAKGKTVDKRTDIWAFGVVLWEMLTGRRLFNGDSVSEVIAAVLTKDPAWDETPPRFRFVLQRCLEKDPKRRLRDIGDARLLLEEAPAQDQPSTSPKLRWVPWAVAAALAIALATMIIRSMTRVAPDALPAQFTLNAPPGTQLSNSSGAVSPDGSYIVFVASGSSNGLWLPPLDSLDAQPIPETEGGTAPCISPDNKSIVFYVSGGTLKRVHMGGGASEVLATSIGVVLPGPACKDDGTVLFGTLSGLYLRTSGGAVRTLTERDPARQETGFSFPQFLPDGRFLYLIQSSNPDTEGLYVGSIERAHERVRIMSTQDRAVYLPPQDGWPAYLVFLSGQTLMGQRFDVSALRREGEPMRIAEGVSRSSGFGNAFSISSAGPLVYGTGTSDSDQRLTWMSRDGKRSSAAPVNSYQSFRLSPDAKDVLLDAVNGFEDIWRYDFDRGVRSPMTSGGKRDVVPVWSPDGRQFAFMSNRSGPFQLYRKDARGGGPEEELTVGPNSKYLTDWSPDGKYLLYSEVAPNTKDDLWALPLEAPRTPTEVLRTEHNEHNGVFSPDRRWIAYASDESTQEQVYIQPFPPTGFNKWQVSNAGGSRPRWPSKDAKELFYLGPGRDTVMAADVVITPGGTITTKTPHQLFKLPWSLPVLVSPYDVTADGQRFLVLEPAGASTGSAPLTVVMNWRARLKK